MNTFLLEIGTEEIPAGYIQPALAAMADNLARKLQHARLSHGEIKTYGTPRRLVVTVDQMADRQASLTEEVLGPPERVAYDEKGQPTIAARKFAEKIGVPVKRLKIRETEKGRYISATATDKGQPAGAVLQHILPEVILGTPFPKTMRWSDLNIAFARPIQSVLAILGDKVVPFALDRRIKSGRFAWGHMFMHHKKVKIARADDYFESMQAARVIVDIETRKQMVREEIGAAAEKLGGKILPDDDLLDIVTNLVEIPFASGGRFDESFLELPNEILITAMRQHQKYFAVVDDAGKLMPCFVAVNNTRTRDMNLVAKGHQRVLRARLSDAQFFYHADLKDRMDDWAERLKGVLFQAQLGTMHAKTQRIISMCSFLADAVAPEIKSRVERAAQLCKTDLVSQVVYEFANLQGIMGRVYATVAGEPDDVAAAIEEHYRPTYSGGPLPQTLTGSLLAIADKLDTICGCFSVGLVPTGASDPYALRRQAIGIVQIMRHHQLGLSLRQIIETSLDHFDPADKAATADAIVAFFQNRLAHMLSEEGFAKDVIAAVTSVSVDHIPDVWLRTAALQHLKGAADFEPLAVAFKRVVNILRKAEVPDDLSINPNLMEHASENQLFESYQKVADEVRHLLGKGDLQETLSTIATLREPVDRFFDDVMVMAENQQLRENRLALLMAIASLFNRIADFSKMAT